MVCIVSVNRTAQETRSRKHMAEENDQHRYQEESAGLRRAPLSKRDGPSADEVFNFMVKNMNGMGTLEDIQTKSRLFPITFDINGWFRRHKSRFTLIERDRNISFVQVFDKNVNCCLNYNTMDSCNNIDCQRYHICKNMLAEKCMRGRSCERSHNCFDEHNGNISERLGYSSCFTDKEICCILKLSFPHVCSAWALKSFCGEENCVRLHICPRYILGKCENGPKCQQVHDRMSEHNKPILDAFEMSDLPEQKFKWRVFMIFIPAWKINESRASDGSVQKPMAKQLANNRSLLKEDEDGAGETYICLSHLQDGCRNRRCKFIHSDNRLPYVWQIQIFGKWVSLHESEDVEKAYAENLSRTDKFHTTLKDIDFVIRIFFEPAFKASVSIQNVDDPGEKTDARRLTTKSYLQDIEEMPSSEDQSKGNINSFCTQWRWYWMVDVSQWQLFEPDAFQHTLEAKFLAGQDTYIFSRENFLFSYTIAFKNMFQTNNDTGMPRLIRRRPLIVTAEDVKNKKFPEPLSDVSLVETPLPASWVPWDMFQPFELVDITDARSSEVDEVEKLFFNTIDRRKEKINRIFRLQNRNLWGLFCSQERTMEVIARREGISVDKRYLFHGTDGLNAVYEICVNNFDLRLSGKTGTKYGDGVYFARDAKYSHAYTKEPDRYIFVANVLVGQYTKGHKSFRRPPQKPGSTYELFDSCVDDITNPSIFVVSDKNQYYPEYLIKYHDIKQDDIA